MAHFGTYSAVSMSAPIFLKEPFCKIDFDSLPDPDVYLQKRYILEKMMSLLFLYLSFPVKN